MRFASFFAVPAVLSAAVALAPAAQAQDARFGQTEYSTPSGTYSMQAPASGAGAPMAETSLKVGGGIGFAPEYEGSNDYQPVPLISFEYTRPEFVVKSNGLGVEVDFEAAKSFDYGPLVRYNMGRDDVDDTVVNRLRDVDGTLEVGAFVGGGMPLNRLGLAGSNANLIGRVEVAQDMLGSGHDGFTAEVSAGVMKPLSSQTTLITSLSSTYASDDYMKSFFSIDANNAARSGLAQFDAESGFKSVTLSAVASHQVTSNWSVSGIGAVTRLLGDAADSPVTDTRGSDTQLFMGLSLGYTF